MTNMTNEESLEILSTRYVAPRIMRLTSGRIAIVPMMGKGEPKLVDYNDATPVETLEELYDAIPSVDDLERTYSELRETVRAAPTRTPKPLQASLEDLA